MLRIVFAQVNGKPNSFILQETKDIWCGRREFIQGFSRNPK
jgi:hypothetical protein